MALSNCKRCGAIFSRVQEPLCASCIREEEASLEQANDWLRKHPGQTINALSDDTGIGRRQILVWIRQKRITLTDKVALLYCKRCDEVIFSGTLCDRCKLSLTHDVGQQLTAIKESSSIEEEYKGMHYRPEDRENR